MKAAKSPKAAMYIKAVNPRLQAEVSPGDIVQAGVIISNSEVGLGSVSIQPLIYRLVCSNGMVVNEAAARRNHVGRVTDSGEISASTRKQPWTLRTKPLS